MCRYQQPRELDPFPAGPCLQYRLDLSTSPSTGQRFCSKSGQYKLRSRPTFRCRCQSSPVPMRHCRRKVRLGSSSCLPNLCSTPFPMSYLVRKASAVSTVLTILEMQHYADLCAGNQEIWESRSEAISMSDETVIVQPAVEDAAQDERFSTLFPLSLPVSLVEARNLEPGPMGANDGGSPVAATGNSSLPQTPMTTPRKTTLADGCTRHPESPSAKAMRAVYHANLLDQRHRLSSWTRGVPIPGLQANGTFGNLRRSSTPAALSTGGL